MSAAPQTRLDRAAIIQAALKLLDEVGIDGLSTRRLADELGIRGPSLYWHFKSKRELFDHMAEAILYEALPQPDLEVEDFDWLAWLAQGARGIRRVTLSRRDSARVLAGAQETGSHPVLAFPTMTERLRRSGWDESEAQLAMLALGRFAVGWVMHEQAAGARATPADGEAGFEFGLATFLAGLEARAGAQRAPSAVRRQAK